MDQIKLLREDLQTPCYIIDKEELERSIKGFHDALLDNFREAVVGYSVKTNSLPYCLGVANRMNCFAEVVSYDEYNLVLACGFQKDRIVYNGPMKSRDTFIDAIINGAIVNIETKRELEWLKDLPNDKIYNIGIRLNINISQISPMDADGDNDNSRFGFSDETQDFSNALDIIRGISNVRLTGLHIHRTAHNRSINFYKNSILYACTVIQKYQLHLKYLDVGGGYFGIFSNKPTYRHYSNAFKEALAEYGLDNIMLIVEPGNALVASCFSFLSEVIDVKHVEKDRWFITTDSSRNDIDPFFRKSSYIVEFYGQADNEIVSEQVISGCTCLENDRLFTVFSKPLLSVGNKILYKNVGAYTMCLSPLFIRYIPNVYVMNSDHYTLVREKWSEIEYLQKSMI